MKVVHVGRPTGRGLGKNRARKFDFVELAQPVTKNDGTGSRAKALAATAKAQERRQKTLRLLNHIREIVVNAPANVESCKLVNVDNNDKKIRAVIYLGLSDEQIADLGLSRKPEKILIHCTHRLRPTKNTDKEFTISFIDEEGKSFRKPGLGLKHQDYKLAYSIADCFEQYLSEQDWKLLMRENRAISKAVVEATKRRLAERAASES